MLVVEKFMICDECGKTHGVDNRGYNAVQHRKSAKKSGWYSKGKIDLCPECWEVRAALSGLAYGGEGPTPMEIMSGKLPKYSQ